MSGFQFNSLCPEDHFIPFAPGRGSEEGQTPGPEGFYALESSTPVTSKHGGERPNSCSFVALSQWP